MGSSAILLAITNPPFLLFPNVAHTQHLLLPTSLTSACTSRCRCSRSNGRRFPSLSLRNGASFVLACLPTSSSSSSSAPNTSSTKLYVSGLSFRTTEESLRKAFENFGQLIEVNLVMDKIANRPRGFAFIRYVTEEESQKAIEGMHGKEIDAICLGPAWI
ncbi:organelle RRM domain-containing protein 6, chloroplastic isoform X2 [Juglans microcarpa x Juglans regia]|uniref:organelle RRM domain-containing protein 6, chloroplastic isoform X2 n=1 Tax=Juglans microcarpa x Juglans regia TaxID=2249226 RepID=UPI001B7DA704|nr:organelle RRM domain-containing protein 6, chloroplastic isoform X2 [Juglans microcarpa x Juglans regia]